MAHLILPLAIPRDKGPDIAGEPLLSISDQRPTQSEASGPKEVVPATTRDLSSESGILRTLCSDPPRETVVEALRLLCSQKASPPQVVKCLLDIVLPQFWDSFSRGERQLLSKCLDSPIGLGGCVGKVKILIPQIKDKEGLTADAKKHEVHNLLSLIQSILGRSGCVRDTWVRTENEAEIKRTLLWKEYTALIGSGRLLSIAAEAENSLGRFDADSRKLWITNGNHYAIWLGREIATAATRMELMEDEGWKPLCQLMSSSFRLGYTDVIVEQCTFQLIHPENEFPRLQKLLSPLAAHDKRLYLSSLLRILSHKYLNSGSTDEKWWELDSKQVSGAAAFLNTLIMDDDFKSSLMEWLTSTTGGGVGSNIGIRRAIVCVVSTDPISFKQLFEKSLNQFADRLWIQHTPIMRQEVNVQILLLCVGYAHRHNPSLLKKLVRSSLYLNAISGRLGLSSERARFLGMIVGESCSAFIDEGDAKLLFGAEETQTSEAMWWKSISAVEDRIGTLEDLSTSKEVVLRKKPKSAPQSTPSALGQDTLPSSGIQVVTEPDSESDDEFTPYENPEGDGGYDSPTEDATTIDRSAPKPPVYIRDLISYLHNTTSYDHQLHALTHASTLIRRNATRGTFLSAELPTLLPLLANLTDTFEIKDFDSLRLNALISLVVCLPIPAGHQLTRLFFSTSYSLSQSATLLLAIGLAARELGGFAPPPPPTPQPVLPTRTATQWDLTTSTLKRELLAPMAVSAVAASAGPAVLQTRTFSSRLAAESRRAKPAARAISGIAAEAFFYPLTGGWWVAVRDGTLRTDPQLTGTFLKTLAVVVHSAGPGAAGSVQMGRELWALALGLGVNGEAVVSEAALVAVLTVLEVHDDGERVVNEMGREVVETREWVGRLVEEAEGEERALAAGVLVKIQEVVGGWERRLMGEFGVEM